MVAIKHNNIEVLVPESWDDITLGFYEEINFTKPTTIREKVNLVAQICKVEPEILLNWPAEIFDIIIDKLYFILNGNLSTPIPEVVIDKKTYVVTIEEKLTLAEWVDIDTIQKKGEKILSNILAIVCRPVDEAYNHNNNDDRAALFAAQPVSKITGVLAFFLRCKTVSEQRIASYSNLVQTVAQLPMNTKYLLKPGAGIKLSTIWQTVKYYFMILLLHYQLQKFLRICNTKKTSNMQKKHKTN